MKEGGKGGKGGEGRKEEKEEEEEGLLEGQRVNTIYCKRQSIFEEFLF